MSIIAHSSTENTLQRGDAAHGCPRPFLVPRRGAALYLAAPLSTYNTPRYEWALLWLRTCAPPGVPIIHARDAFTSTADWRARWPAVLARLAGLVFIADEAGYIGAGVWREMGDALAHGLPVLYLDDRGDVHPYHALHFGPANADNWRRYRLVTLAAEGGAP